MEGCLVSDLTLLVLPLIMATHFVLVSQGDGDLAEVEGRLGGRVQTLRGYLILHQTRNWKGVMTLVPS